MNSEQKPVRLRTKSNCDARHILENDVPFSCRLSADKALIYWHGRLAATVTGKKLDRLRAVLDSGDELAAQHLMARLTGNFKHGNER